MVPERYGPDRGGGVARRKGPVIGPHHPLVIHTPTVSVRGEGAGPICFVCSPVQGIPAFGIW